MGGADIGVPGVAGVQGQLGLDEAELYVVVSEEIDQVGEAVALRSAQSLLLLLGEDIVKVGWVFDLMSRFLKEAAKNPVRESTGPGSGEDGGAKTGLLHTGSMEGVWYSRQTATRAICMDLRASRRAAYSRASLRRVGMWWVSRREVPASRGMEMQSLERVIVMDPFFCPFASFPIFLLYSRKSINE